MLLGLPGVQFGTAAVLPQPKTASEREVRGQPVAPVALHMKTEVFFSVKVEYWSSLVTNMAAFTSSR